MKTLVYDVGEGGVATITISRPESMNAITPIMCEEFANVWAEVKRDPDVRSCVLRAAPSRAFSTGVDTKEALPWPWADMVWDRVDPFGQIGPKQNQVWKPVVAAVHGMCSGAGWYFLNEADVVICDDEATFFDSHLTFGMVAAVEPAGMLATVPFREVMRMVLLSNDERVGAETALRLGIVTEVTTPEALWGRAQELATQIAEKNPLAVQGSVRAMWEALDLGRRDAIDRSLTYVTIGNPLSMQQVDRSKVVKRPWVLR
jgi:enoyl-CoA hydratase/carnithine racemase